MDLWCDDGNSVQPGCVPGCLKRSLPWIRKKVPLQTLDICRRCRRVLYKLKADLQNLGLSRRQVRRGLIQLATRPLVVLTRQPTGRPRRHGWRRRLFLDDDEKSRQASTICTTNAPSLECNSRQETKNAQKSHGVEAGAAEKAEVLKAHKTAPINDLKESLISSRNCKPRDNTGTALHSFDKALEQLDKIVSFNMNPPEKSVNKMSSVIVSADTTSKSQNKGCTTNKHSPPYKRTVHSENKNLLTQVENDNRVTERGINLVSDKVPSNTIRTLVKDKKNRIKLNFSSCFNHKKTDSAKSNVNRKLDTNERASAHVEEYSLRDSGGNKSTSEGVSEKGKTTLSDNRVAAAEKDTHKKRLHDEVTADSIQKRKKICASYNEIKAIDRKKRKKVMNKFRTYFGDCVSLSEDEQEQYILQKQFKRRRKKDSVDSCDSGVCTTEGSVTASYVEILKDFQTAVPDSTIHEESDERAPEKIPAKAEVIDETKEATKVKSIETTDQVEVLENGTEVDRLENTDKVKEVRSVENVENSVEGEAIGHVQNVTTVAEIENVKQVKSTQDVTENGVQNSACNPIVKIVTEIIVLDESIVCDGSIVEQTTAETDVTPTSRATDKSEVDVPIPEAEAGMDATTVSHGTSEKCNEGGVQRITAEDSSGSPKRKNVDPTDMNELLRLTFNETCQITSDGNVISIRENAKKKTKKDTDENSNLKILTEVGPNNEPNDKEQASNDVEENNNTHSKETVISSDAKEDGEAVSMNSDTGDASGSIIKSVLQRSELNSTTEKKEDAQPNKVPQARLRVLSSIELGSRWCPTPVNSFPSTVPQSSDMSSMLTLGGFLKTTATTNSVSSTAPLTQTVSATATIIATPLVTSTPAETTSSDTTTKTDVNAKARDFPYASFTKIRDLLLCIRASSLPSGLDVDKLLAKEFVKMKKLSKADSYAGFIQEIVSLLNRDALFGVKPLSFAELFHYTPALESIYVRVSNVHNIIANTAPQNSAPTPAVQSQYPPNLSQPLMNISSMQSQQNFQENVILQPEFGNVQNNIPTNSATNPLLSLQQVNYRLDMQRPPFQQTYIPRNRPAATNATQGVPLRHVLCPSTAINQPRKPSYVPNSSFTNQQYVQQSVYDSQANTFYTVNTPVSNHPIQQNVNPAKINQQQNINPAYMIQQQNMNHPHVIQQQHVYSAQRIRQQNINPIYRAQQQNINPAPGMQQQNMNPTQVINQQAINVSLGIHQQPINLASQPFKKTVRRKSSCNTAQGTAQPKIVSQLSKKTQQNVSAIKYIPQPVENMFAPNAPQVAPKSAGQCEQIHHTVPSQSQMKVLKNFAMEQMKTSQYPQAVRSSRTKVHREKKKQNAVQVSLESTMKQFDILKYLSDIQKIMLLKHMSFYFNCTAWLEQDFTFEEWQMITSERSWLLNFQTLLKHLVDKIMKDLLQNECQGTVTAKNVLMDIKIDVPKTVQIIVQDSNRIHCQVQVSKAEQVQREIIALDECSTTSQENLSAVEEQSQKKQETTDDLQNTKSSDETQESKMLLQEETQSKDPSTKQLQEKKQDEEVTQVENHSEAATIAETPIIMEMPTIAETPTIAEAPTSNDSENQKDVTEKDSKSCIPLCNIETKKNESEKTIEDTRCAAEDEVVASDLDQSNKDAKQPPNTHLVTVEISPNNDQVKVIDTDATREIRDTVIKTATEKPKESEQKAEEEETPHTTCALPSPEDSTSCEAPAEAIADSPDDDIKYFNYTDLDISLMEENLVTHIADVRSISIEAFEEMEGVSNPSTGVAEGNIEEEEIKICLFCSKPSTVVCSLCLEAKYCSKACSELHWEKHYKTCKPVVKSIHF